MAANYQDHKEYFSPATARGDRDRPSGAGKGGRAEGALAPPQSSLLMCPFC